MKDKVKDYVDNMYEDHPIALDEILRVKSYDAIIYAPGTIL